MGSSISTGLANPECTGKQPHLNYNPKASCDVGLSDIMAENVFLMRMLSVLRDSRLTPCPNTGSPQRRKSRPYTGEEMKILKVSKLFEAICRKCKSDLATGFASLTSPVSLVS